MVLDEPEVILKELAEVRALGVGTIVETTVAGWGRDVARLRWFSERSGLHIVATSGYYVEVCLPADSHRLDVGVSRLETSSASVAVAPRWVQSSTDRGSICATKM
jgi:predicted metal-dependent phosphotriesterase family hydrolase